MFDLEFLTANSGGLIPVYFSHSHGGHLINLLIALGLELGGCEAYPGVFQPFGGYPSGCALGGGVVRPTGAGLRP
jgi:hypothetical protein